MVILDASRTPQKAPTRLIPISIINRILLSIAPGSPGKSRRSVILSRENPSLPKGYKVTVAP